jgi:quinol monooxygenase YgiN
MVLEIAEFTAIDGKADEFATGASRGVEVIRRAEGCHSAQVSQSVEDPQQFVLLIQWHRIENHLDTFRNGPLFSEYRSHIAGLFVDQPRVRHFPLKED